MYFNHDGLKLFYHQEGAGAPLIILHGGPGLSHLHLRDQLRPLAATQTLYFLDFGAHGQSQDRAGLTLTDLAAEVEGLRRHLGFERVSILGHSMGGFVAEEYAARYPAHLDRLLLVGTAATAPDVAAKQWRRLSLWQRLAFIGLMLKHGPAFLRGQTVKLCREHMQIAGHTYYKHERYREAVVSGYVDSFSKDCPSYTSLQRCFAALDLRPLLTKPLGRPTLILCGDGDTLMTDKQEELRALFPGAEFQWLDSGHDPFIEDRERFFDLVTRFLSQEVAP